MVSWTYLVFIFCTPSLTRARDGLVRGSKEGTDGRRVSPRKIIPREFSVQLGESKDDATDSNYDRSTNAEQDASHEAGKARSTEEKVLRMLQTPSTEVKVKNECTLPIEVTAWWISSTGERTAKSIPLHSQELMHLTRSYYNEINENIVTLSATSERLIWNEVEINVGGFETYTYSFFCDSLNPLTTTTTTTTATTTSLNAKQQAAGETTTTTTVQGAQNELQIPSSSADVYSIEGLFFDIRASKEILISEIRVETVGAGRIQLFTREPNSSGEGYTYSESLSLWTEVLSAAGVTKEDTSYTLAIHPPLLIPADESRAFHLYSEGKLKASRPVGTATAWSGYFGNSDITMTHNFAVPDLFGDIYYGVYNLNSVSISYQYVAESKEQTVSTLPTDHEHPTSSASSPAGEVSGTTKPTRSAMITTTPVAPTTTATERTTSTKQPAADTTVAESTTATKSSSTTKTTTLATSTTTSTTKQSATAADTTVAERTTATQSSTTKTTTLATSTTASTSTTRQSAAASTTTENNKETTQHLGGSKRELQIPSSANVLYSIEGVFFDIKANRQNVLVSQMKVETVGAGRIQLFTREPNSSGEGYTYGESQSSWIEVLSADGPTADNTIYTIFIQPPLMIPAGQSRAFHLYSAGKIRAFRPAGVATAWSDYFGNSEIVMSNNFAVPELFGNTYYGVYNLNGASITYSITDTTDTISSTPATGLTTPVAPQKGMSQPQHTTTNDPSQTTQSRGGWEITIQNNCGALIDVKVQYKASNGAWSIKTIRALRHGHTGSAEIVSIAPSFRITHKKASDDKWLRASISLDDQPSQYVHTLCAEPTMSLGSTTTEAAVAPEPTTTEADVAPGSTTTEATMAPRSTTTESTVAPRSTTTTESTVTPRSTTTVTTRSTTTESTMVPRSTTTVTPGSTTTEATVAPTVSPITSTCSEQSLLQAVDSDYPLTGRDREWLLGHNKERQYYHTKYLSDDSCSPLIWSRDLKESAQTYANKMISLTGCSISHDTTWDGGENLVFDRGGIRPNVDNVLSRWVKMEEHVPFPKNGHFMQVLWRGTEHVGCADARKVDRGLICYIQVCRYIRKGNCDVDKDNWRTKMLIPHEDWEDPYPCRSSFQINA